jgi:hypothetical protein
VDGDTALGLRRACLEPDSYPRMRKCFHHRISPQLDAALLQRWLNATNRETAPLAKHPFHSNSSGSDSSSDSSIVRVRIFICQQQSFPIMSGHEKGRSPKRSRNVPDGRGAIPTQARVGYDWRTHLYPHSDCCCGLFEEFAQEHHPAAKNADEQSKLVRSRRISNRVTHSFYYRLGPEYLLPSARLAVHFWPALQGKGLGRSFTTQAKSSASQPQKFFCSSFFSLAVFFFAAKSTQVPIGDVVAGRPYLRQIEMFLARSAQYMVILLS